MLFALFGFGFALYPLGLQAQRRAARFGRRGSKPAVARDLSTCPTSDVWMSQFDLSFTRLRFTNSVLSMRVLAL